MIHEINLSSRICPDDKHNESTIVAPQTEDMVEVMMTAGTIYIEPANVDDAKTLYKILASSEISIETPGE